MTRRARREAVSPRVLYVCSANRCRSPFAEATLRAVAGSLPLQVSSAGFLKPGEPTPPTGLEVAQERGLDLDGHRSRRLDDEMLADHDLILTMERRHSRELVAAHPELAARVFTVKQFDRWIATHPRRRRAALRPWLEVAGAERSARELLGSSDADDTFDPLTSPAQAWRDMADDFERHAALLVRWMFDATGQAVPSSTAAS